MGLNTQAPLRPHRCAHGEISVVFGTPVISVPKGGVIRDYEERPR